MYFLMFGSNSMTGILPPANFEAFVLRMCYVYFSIEASILHPFHGTMKSSSPVFNFKWLWFTKLFMAPLFFFLNLELEVLRQSVHLATRSSCLGKSSNLWSSCLCSRQMKHNAVGSAVPLGGPDQISMISEEPIWDVHWYCDSVHQSPIWPCKCQITIVSPVELSVGVGGGWLAEKDQVQRSETHVRWESSCARQRRQGSLMTALPSPLAASRMHAPRLLHPYRAVRVAWISAVAVYAAPPNW